MGSVLRLDLGTITDSPSGSLFDEIDFASMSVSRRTSLLEAVRAIQTAATDERIEGIYINFGDGTAVSMSALEELRVELERFKESGKFIVAYQDTWSQIGYWFSSVADKIYTNPLGGVQWTGLSMELMFYKGLLDKLDIEPVVVRHGSFKSAVEPFIMEGMSPENRLQYETMVGSLWGIVLEGVSESRHLSVDDLQNKADDLAIDSPQSALEGGMIDGVVYEDEVVAEMGSMLATPTDDPHIVPFADYLSQVSGANPSSPNKIAVIYAEGDIVSGEGAQGQVGNVPMVDKIRQARDDEGTVAVVLRINSPGGSALASEVMWRELEMLKEEKPLIVSMGSVAASGGYYIASPADAIYADRSTLTGSIGVFGLFPNVGRALENKLGVTTDVVRSNRHSDIGSIYRTPTTAELAYLQRSVEDVYTTFVGHVADGRNMTPDAVDAIGQGRVWSGVDALNNGLIDGFGGLVDAISLAAERVGVTDDFRVWEVLDPASPFDALLSGLSMSVRGHALRDLALRDELGTAFTHYQQLRTMLNEDEIQARLPYTVEIN
jgi:protease-4